MLKKSHQQRKNIISLIIPNFNGAELLRNNLPIVMKAFENSENRILEVIVIDDCSTDESVRLIKEAFPQIKLIKHTKNRGFAASVNTGARSSKGKYLALLNNDVLPEKSFLVSVIKHFENKQVFAVSLHEKGYSWSKGFIKDGFIVHQPGLSSRVVQSSFWANGGSGVFRRSMWMKLKGLDEELFSPFYWEDIDLCYRAQKRGWQVLWEPNSFVVHRHESTIGKLPLKTRQRIQERNQLLFIWKNMTSPILFKKHVAGLLKYILKHPGYVKVFFSALVKINQVRAKREIEKKEGCVSDEVIFSRFS